ncbi:DUF6778 family protein [Sinisalibacter aestuarii]|uniref:Lipoprotein n=1 Tax=Sinisalibacter aestuarii TaxID=2949426 RepID=A0ABQ5LT57_9RHOB|nr:DUF6778 family protein [Sinisalibacter aestuarii]GKY87595.1 hypothetical protein STA1M1_14640 [Sinisalibacter aestuarii]
MKSLRIALILAAAAALSACSGGHGGLVTRADSNEMPLLGSMMGEHAPVPLNPSYKVTGIEVTVPQTLTTSEENSIKPRVDLLWQGEPLGDRHAQVDAIVTEALTAGVAGLDGARAVKIEAVVTRFHALTMRTRYSIGGEHEIWMVMAIRDAETGELLEPAREIGFDLPVSPAEALANEANGIYQKDEIEAAIREMIRYEITRPRDFLQG